MNAFFHQLSQAVKGMFQFWVVLAPWEHALRVRRGRKVRYFRAGIHLRIPLIDRFFVQSVRLRMADMPIQTLTTADGKAVTLKGQLGYRIENLEALYDTLHDAEGTLMNMAQMAIADHVVGCSSEDCDPRSIAKAVNGQLSGEFKEYGLADVRLSITDYAIVKTYRLITQDIWSNTGMALETSRDHMQAE